MVVSGTDDYTGRFDYYVKHIAEHKSIGVLESELPISYVTAWDAAEFLYAMPYTWKLSNARTASAGFEFSPIRKSIAGMVQESMAHWALE